MDVLRLTMIHAFNGYAAPATHVSWSPDSADCAEAQTPVVCVASRLLLPFVSAELMAAVAAVVPADLWPRLDDTAESLRSRLSHSTFLDDAHVPTAALVLALGPSKATGHALRPWPPRPSHRR